MYLAVDRPRDRLLTDRVEILSGWVSTATSDFNAVACCGDYEIPLRRCAHPWAIPVGTDRYVQGFYAYLLLQDWIPHARHRKLQVHLLVNRVPLETVHLQISPLAMETAREFPLNTRVYRLCANANPFAAKTVPRTLVFPSLGGVGGMSVQQLFRMNMYREGQLFPVYDEANDPASWADKARSHLEEFRWIDGHGCYRCPSFLNGPAARICLLREPVRRFVSIYNYNRLVHPFNFAYQTLEDFLASPQARLYSQAAGLLALCGNPDAAKIHDEDLYALANDELERHYDCVGITELFEESLFCFSLLGGWEEIGMWWRMLSAPVLHPWDELSGETVERIRKLLAADCRLYDARRSRLLELVGTAGFGDSLTEYKTDAARNHELPDALKMAECLRWRQKLEGEIIFHLRNQLAGSGNLNRSSAGTVPAVNPSFLEVSST
jgi:Galactose-3-O-sulfotransferase